MHPFSPYAVHHVQIINALKLQAPQNSFVVLWWRKIPLGHLWIDAENAVKTEAGLCAQIIRAVAPALNFYFSADDTKLAWPGLIAAADFEALQQLLESSATLQIFSKPHVEAEAISVVICTRNRTQALTQCIHALLQSSDKNFELVIVDNAPDDDSTQKLVQQFPSVRYVRENRKGLSHARNTGVQQATHELIAFTDDDVLVDKNWTAHLKNCFTDPYTMCVTGLVIPVQLQTKAAYIFEKYWSFSRGYVPLVFDQAYFNAHKESGVPVWEIGAGANMAFRKSLFQHIGYFDERLGAGASGCSGDSELWYRALAEGFQCNYFPHLFVYHQHRDSKQELKQQLFSYMRGHVASLLVQYERYQHNGNLKRLYHELPKWYKDRLRSKLRGRYSPIAGTLFTEIRGYISGWLFYQKHKP